MMIGLSFSYIFKDVVKVFLRSLTFGLSLAKPRDGWKSVIAFALEKSSSFQLKSNTILAVEYFYSQQPKEI